MRIFKNHMPEYLIEAALLGLFMISACTFGALLEYPQSPVRDAIGSAFLRRVIMGFAMGLTAIGLMFSPWGQRSGAHMNPAVTLAFFRLGKINPADAAAYIAFQFAGGALGVSLIALVLGKIIQAPSVNYVATIPGTTGPGAAWIAEFTISFVMMITVLIVSNRANLARYTPYFAAALLALFITFESPLSGMSINPARTLASALPANLWTGFWIYMTAPPLAMLTAAQCYCRLGAIRQVHCAKMHHTNSQRCIFHCEFGRLLEPEGSIRSDDGSIVGKSA